MYTAVHLSTWYLSTFLKKMYYTRNRKFRLVEILRVAPSACWTPVLPTMAAKMDPADAEALFNMFAGAGGKLDAAGLAEVMRVQ